MIEYPTDQDVLEAFASLSGDHAFNRIVLWLESERIALAERGMTAEAEGFQRLQGSYLAVKEFIKIAKDARTVIRNREERRRNPKTRVV
jgi:hypothetical protein